MHSAQELHLETVRDAVAAASHQLAAAGVAPGTAGNLSARVGDLIAVTPTGARLVDVQAEDVTVVDLDGAVVGGTLAPTSELALHLGIYHRYGAGAVVHAHPPAGTALSCVIDELPCIHYSMIALGGDVRVAPYRTFGTPELAEVTVDALEGRTAALMANHGTVTFGNDIAEAVKQAELLEWACQLYVTARTVGTPRVLDEAERNAVIETIAARNYGAVQSV